jgi:NhaP-type Na+/H+ or K+/H+ antiporter
MQIFGKVLAFGMGLTFFLLAYQVPTNVTSVLGWVFGSLLCLAVLMSFVRPSRYSEKHGDRV